MDTLLPDFDTLLRLKAHPSSGESLGKSRDGRELIGYRIGVGERKISLIAGCHADEPIGEKLLTLLVKYLSSLGDTHNLLREYEWWIIPSTNPDGAEANRAWQNEINDCYDLASFAHKVVREAPEDDIEFGFPLSPSDLDSAKRLENKLIASWWLSSPAPFTMHASLHGMGIAAGPWFLVDPNWTCRLQAIYPKLTELCREMGYVLHDIERHGEKGFWRICPGFSTRPSALAMRDYFISQNQTEQSKFFTASSMDFIRSLGGDCLTLVSELPLFIFPTEDKNRQAQCEAWFARLIELLRTPKATRQKAAKELTAAGLSPMPIQDQLKLQYEFLRLSLCCVR